LKREDRVQERSGIPAPDLRAFQPCLNGGQIIAFGRALIAEI
jgi:hypothetical protein